MYRFYVSCAACLTLAATAEAGYFNFDRPDPATAANSVLTSTGVAVGEQTNPAHNSPDRNIVAVGFTGIPNGTTAGVCCRQERSCCRNLWDSYCDDLPGCDRRKNRCRGLGGIFSCQPASAPTCCGPTFPTLRLPKLRMPSICLPSLPRWGRPVFGSSLCRGEGCADADLGGNGTNSDSEQAWNAPTQADQPAESTPSEPSALSRTPAAAAPKPSVSEYQPARQPARTTTLTPPTPLAEEETAEDWSTNPAEEESFEPAHPSDTTPAAAPKADPENSNDLLESDDDLLESAQHRSILRNLQGLLK